MRSKCKILLAIEGNPLGESAIAMEPHREAIGMAKYIVRAIEGKNMGFKVTNELDTFGYDGAVIVEMKYMLGNFYLDLANVIIKPENSVNRDIRDMRTNGYTLKIIDAAIQTIVEEGYNVYNANGELSHRVEDEIIDPSRWYEYMADMNECVIHSIEKEEDIYTIELDTEDHTFEIRVKGASDEESWDRFLSTAQML